MKATVSLVVYKNPIKMIQEVVRCVMSSPLIEKFYVIDNSPTNALSLVEKMDPRVEYRFLGYNAGFGAGHNIAFDMAKNTSAEFHLIVNPDIKFENGVLEKMMGYMSSVSDVGLLMPKVVYPSGEIQRLCKLYPSPINLIFRRFMPFQSIKDELDSDYEMHWFTYQEIQEIPILSGCFMLLKKEVLNQCSFDSRYFMYMEDFDLCRSVRNAGWKLVYYPEVKVTHEFAKGSHKNKKLLYYHIRSALKYFFKWGWFFDSERANINKITKQRILNEKNY